MKRLIQIRGANGSGKSTTMRQYLAKEPGFTLHRIKIQGKEYPYHYNSQKGILVAGIYGKTTCDGCDGIIHDKEIMMKYLTALLDTAKPEIMLFEAIMYGKTVLFAENLINELNERGYNYTGVVLLPPFQFMVRNILVRNGGKRFNVETLQRTYNSVKSSAQKLKESGVDIRFIDSSNYPKNNMSNIIEEVINEEKH